MLNPEALLYRVTKGARTTFYAIVPKEPDDILTEEHQVMVTIDWRYDDIVPSKDQMLLFSVLERAVQPITDSGTHVVLHSSLGDGLRQLCYYTKDYDQYMEDLNKLLGNLPTLPIEINYKTDKRWKYAKKIRKVAMKGELRNHQAAA